jgi:hypothetical protein
VPIEALEIGGPIWHYSVELLSRGHATRKGGVKPAPSDDPGCVVSRACVVKDGMLNGVKIVQSVEIEAVQRDCAHAQVHMGVVEAGHDQSAARIDDGRPIVGERHHITIRTNGADAPIMNCDCRRAAIGSLSRIAGGKEPPAEKYQVGPSCGRQGAHGRHANDAIQYI